MTVDIERIKEKMSTLNDDKLRNIVFIEYGDYEEEVIEIAKNELVGRYGKNIWEAKNTTLKYVIDCIEYEDLEKAIIELYPNIQESINNYYIIFDRLLTIIPKQQDKIRIFIDVDDDTVFCEDIKTGEKIIVKYCEWDEWLGFYINNRQLQQLGKEKYMAYCLIEMTSVGMNENTIKTNFNGVLDTVANKNISNDTISLLEADNEITYKKIAKRGNLIRKGLTDDEECSQIRPWVRFWARTIDIMIWLTIVRYIELRISSPITKWISSFAWGTINSLLSYTIWVFIEALLLSKCGYTLGKWIFKIHIRDTNGNRLLFIEALKRGSFVLLYGEGLMIPFVTIITNIKSYNRLIDRGKTKWDEEGKFVVYHEKIGCFKIILATIIIVGNSIISRYIYHI
ncbi:DUF6557 family protein [Inediibacterium massiliense]|uniref:DUF6557 family protein n=1 Tax=Inediibacterium massiliense TaxID=1658111 RepID=UPI0006B5A5D4|nr:DUF6557 family protein [Inediibacterium massiliense]